MKVLLRLTVIGLCLHPLAAAPAQKNDRQEKAAQSTPDKAPKPRKANGGGRGEAESAAGRQEALWLLDGVEAGAKRLDGSILKVRVLAKVADTLWQYDESRARALFADAFRAVDSVKLDADKDPRARMAAASDDHGPLTDLRAEVLRLVAARDFRLAENMRQAIGEAAGAGAGTDGPPAGSREREELAWDVAVAAAGAQPELTAQFVRAQLRGGVSEDLGWALVAIGRENRQLAEQLYSEALAAARADLTAPEHLENLAVYVLPTEEETFRARAADPARAAALKNFLGYAADRLAAQSASGHAPTPRGSEAQREYRTLQALLPLFESLAPGRVPLARERMAVLLAAMPPRQADAAAGEEDLSDSLRRAEAITDGRRRDARLMQLSMTAARRGDFDQAVSIAERIGDPQERSLQVSLLNYQAAVKAVGKSDTGGAHRLALKIEFLPQRVAAFNLLDNKLRAAGETERATAVAGEIWEWTIKSPNSPQKAKALLTLVAAASRHDAERGFEMLAAAVKSINGTDFSSSEAAATSPRVVRVTLDMLDLEGAFSKLARVNFDRAAQAAQSLTHKEASLLAQAAVCRQALALDNAPRTRKPTTN